LEELGECVCGSADPATQLELEELKTAIVQYLQELPERDRNIFLRRYFYLEDTASIARRYVLRQANVRLILSRTRQKLKDFLQKEGLV
jgi:RNA polymerase sigma-70 factor (ECF subfamily)